MLIITIISSIFAFIKYNVEKNANKKYSIYDVIIEIKGDIFEAIRHFSVQAIILWGSIISSLAIYTIACVVYPSQFISTYVFVIDNWVQLEIVFLLIFIYIVYKIQKDNLKHQQPNEDIWINWVYNIILIIFWLLLIYIVINFLQIKAFIFK
jgi:hypothetical protein